MNKFHYSRTYTFQEPGGGRKHYFFNLIERHGSKAIFILNDGDHSETMETDMVTEGDTETAAFTLCGIDVSLRADRYIPKDYPLTTEGRKEKEEERLEDAYLHTIYNRDEIERSKECYCISCQTIFKPEEVECYADEGTTGICPYCYIDAIIADDSGIRMTDKLLADLHTRYFDYSINPLIELTIAEADESKPTPCSPYVWIVRMDDQEICAVDAAFYTREEAPDKLRDFLKAIPAIIPRTQFEAIDCQLQEIEGREAVDAISRAITKYFDRGAEATKEEPNDSVNERDVDFAITTAWNDKTAYFTLLADGTIAYLTVE